MAKAENGKKNLKTKRERGALTIRVHAGLSLIHHLVEVGDFIGTDCTYRRNLTFS